jgi:hypothetical protein
VLAGDVFGSSVVEKLRPLPKKPGPILIQLPSAAGWMASWVQDGELISGSEGLKDQILESLDVEQSPVYTISDPLSAREGIKAALLFPKNGRPDESVVRGNEVAFRVAEMLRANKSTESF